jgi:hypothetical protein
MPFAFFSFNIKSLKSFPPLLPPVMALLDVMIIIIFIYLKDNIMSFCVIAINAKGNDSNNLCHNISSINPTRSINLICQSQPFNKSLFTNFGYSMNLHLLISPLNKPMFTNFTIK